MYEETPGVQSLDFQDMEGFKMTCSVMRRNIDSNNKDPNRKYDKKMTTNVKKYCEPGSTCASILITTVERNDSGIATLEVDSK
jgi:hypothetical protein